MALPSIAIPMVDSKLCLLPIAVGFDRVSLPRWYFDAPSGTCKLFIYHGSNNAENVFKTLDECIKACHTMMMHYQSKGSRLLLIVLFA